MRNSRSSSISPKSWLSHIGNSRTKSGTSEKKIGILTPGYGLEKVSYGLELEEFQFIKLNRIPLQKIIKGTNIFTQCPFIVGGPVNILHSFNMLPLNKDFVLSFETELPRFLGNTSQKSIDFGYKILQSERCKGIYSLSDAGKKFAQRRMRERGLEKLADEVRVFRGGFQISENDFHSRPKTGPIKACFVGGDMFRKGIEPLVAALKILRKGGLEIELTVVGSASDTIYPVPGFIFDKFSLLNTLEEETWITYHSSLPNMDVLNLFRQSHVFLFPSLDESLGWVLVESGLCSIPRIATNIYAFPELIEHLVDGWMIDLPLDQDLRWKHLGKSSAKEGWLEAKTQITCELVKILGGSDITIDRLAKMGKQAKNSMMALYGIDRARTDLAKIYNKAIL